MNPAEIIRYIPLITRLMTLAEQAFGSGVNTGKEKKEFVITALLSGLGLAEDLSEGGQKDYLEQLNALPLGGLFSSLVDMMAHFFDFNDEA